MTADNLVHARADADAGRTGRRPRTDLLLLGGAVAGPLFTSLVVAQALTRDRFDLGHQPLSLLSLGDLGWVQVMNFVVTGLLLIGLAVGVRRVLTTGVGRVWAPLLVGVHGLGLLGGGVFLPDPGLGYPPGTPDEIPEDLTWHGVAHAFTPVLAFVALVACCVLLARRFAQDRQRGRAAYSIATAAVATVLCAWPGQEEAGLRLAVAAFVGLAWTTFIALDLRRRRGTR